MQVQAHGYQYRTIFDAARAPILDRLIGETSIRETEMNQREQTSSWP